MKTLEGKLYMIVDDEGVTDDMATFKPIQATHLLKECLRFRFKEGVELKGLAKLKDFEGVFEGPVGTEAKAKAIFVNAKELKDGKNTNVSTIVPLNLIEWLPFAAEDVEGDETFGNASEVPVRGGAAPDGGNLGAQEPQSAAAAHPEPAPAAEAPLDLKKVQGASQDLHEDSLVLQPCRQASAAQTAQPKPREDSTAEDARRRSAVTVADSKSAPMCRYEKRKAMHRLRALVWVESANRCTELFGKLTRAKLEDEVMKVVRLRFRQQNQDIQLRLLRGEDVSADMLLSFEDPLVPRADLPADDVAAVEAENAEPADGDAEGENGYPLAKPKLNDKENGVRVLTARRLPELSAIIKAELPNYDNKLHEDELRKRARQEFNRLSRHDQWDLARQDLRSLAPRGEDRGRFISRDAEKDMLGIP